MNGLWVIQEEDVANVNVDEGQTVAFSTYKEETGSDGNTGMQCDFMMDLIEEIAISRGANPRVVRANSKCLSADVNAGLDPTFQDVMERRNASFLKLRSLQS